MTTKVQSSYRGLVYLLLTQTLPHITCGMSPRATTLTNDRLQVTPKNKALQPYDAAKALLVEEKKSKAFRLRTGFRIFYVLVSLLLRLLRFRLHICL